MRCTPAPSRLPATLSTALALLLLLATPSVAAVGGQGAVDAGPTPSVEDLDGGPEDAGPTPPVEDFDREREDGGRARSAGAVRDGDVSAGGSGTRSGETATSGDSSAATSVRGVRLARTGSPALAVASLGGLSLLGGVCLLVLRRR